MSRNPEPNVLELPDLCGHKARARMLKSWANIEIEVSGHWEQVASWKHLVHNEKAIVVAIENAVRGLKLPAQRRADEKEARDKIKIVNRKEAEEKALQKVSQVVSKQVSKVEKRASKKALKELNKIADEMLGKKKEYPGQNGRPVME